VTDLIVECIYQSLSNLKPGPATLVYAIAEKSYGVSKEQIPVKPEAFTEALERVFGAGSPQIEMAMKKLIVETFHLREDQNYLSLPLLISEVVYSTNSTGEPPVFGT